MPTKPKEDDAETTDSAPKAKSNLRLQVVGPLSTHAFVGEIDGEAFAVDREPSDVANKTLGDKMIAQAAEHGVEVAYVED